MSMNLLKSWWMYHGLPLKNNSQSVCLFEVPRISIPSLESHWVDGGNEGLGLVGKRPKMDDYGYDFYETLALMFGEKGLHFCMT